MFVVVKLGNKNSTWLVDMVASHNVLKMIKAKRLGLKLKGEQGWIKIMNGDNK